MSYAATHLDPVSEQPEIEMEGGDGNDTDIESGKVSDETLSFLRWKLQGDVPNTNPARDFYRRGAARCCATATCNILPWIINFVLAILVVTLAMQLESEKILVMPKGDEVPMDVIYSECLHNLWKETASSVLECGLT